MKNFRIIVFSSFLFSLFTNSASFSQISGFPYKESFDTVAVPMLPTGWTTTKNKSTAGDFISAASSPRSVPQAVLSTDARVMQSLMSPRFDFTGKFVHTLEFYERRSSSCTSGLLIEASLDNDTAFALPLSDTLKLVSSTSYVLRTISLPPQLNNHPNVRFRLRVTGTGGPTSASGTIRFDDISITVDKAVDLSISSARLEPGRIRAPDPAELLIGITNKAKQGSYGFQLTVTDSMQSVTHVLYQHNYQRVFSEGDSMSIRTPSLSLGAGQHRFIFRLSLIGDEDTSNNSLSTFYYVGCPAGAIKINEIMYAPSDGKEWLECLNTTNDTIDISSWRIADRSSTVIIQPTTIKEILPKTYFLVAKDTTFIERYPVQILPIIKVSIPSLNNDSDAVVLTDPGGWLCDSLQYHSAWGGLGGISLERIDTALMPTTAANWGSSRSPYGATPGFENSIAMKNFDITFSSLTLSPSAPTAGQSVSIMAMVFNRGRSNAENFNVQLFLDANRDSVLQMDELREEQSLLFLAHKDSTPVSFFLPNLVAGNFRFAVRIVYAEDEEPANNISFLSVTIGILPGSVVINEIMYAPPGDMPEWVELYNKTDDPIDMTGWKISDAGSTKASIRFTHPVIPPHSYGIVTTDSSFFNYYSISAPVFTSSFSALNNTTPDAVVLFDQRGLAMDSLWYKPSWGGGNGKTLDRIDYLSTSCDSTNWTGDVPTPGVENIICKKDFDLALASLRLAPSGSSIKITAAIQNRGRQTVTGIPLRFYYDSNNDSMLADNELFYSITFSSALQPSDSVLLTYQWDYSAKGIIRVAGLVKCSNDQRSSNDTLFTFYSAHYMSHSVIINEILYEPRSNQTEFIELYNRSADTINLQSWKYKDTPTSSGSRTVMTLTSIPFYLFPGEYCTLSSDSTLVSQFPLIADDPKNKYIIANHDFSLGNSGDDIILCDQTDYEIDSVHYSPSWHLHSLPAQGRSLERINPAISGNDARNWSSSVSAAGATPCRPNSIYTPLQQTTSRLSLSPNPFSPDGDGFEDFLTISFILPARSSMVRLRCYDIHGRLIRTLANNEPVPAEGTMVWDGYDDQHRRARIGMYILLFEALDNFGGAVVTMKEVAVVAGKL